MPSLIIGCGYLGRRVAARWLAAGRPVAALTRRNSDTLTALGITPVIGDVLDPVSLQNLPAASTVLYAVGMDRSAGKCMRSVYVEGLGHVLDALPKCERFIYVSSTGVYGQTDGELVDESSATEPLEESGRVVLEAERLLRSRRPDAIILRFAGIYGPNRLLRKQPILNGEPLVGDADRWLNLIHVDDGADAVLAAEAAGNLTPQPPSLRRKGEQDLAPLPLGEGLGRGLASLSTFNIADDEAPTRRAFYTLLAELLAAVPAKFDQRPEPGTANRRISNRTARGLLRWSPRYPSYREGLPDAVRRSDGVA
ncbi:MAG: NAD-dependent epimerase/dehydratase family protein [Planctomycetes bacterium]|nr:NAD-dependent epimerase/dehydratase family protein [Planctomycetota bacterium]